VGGAGAAPRSDHRHPGCVLRGNGRVGAPGLSALGLAARHARSLWIADFTIDQVSLQGEWVSHGPLTFPGDTVLVKVTDQGEGPPTADAEADPLRVTC
jgi:hypothetical protein